MGLDVSHDAFHGAYSAFNRLRQAVCRAAGGSFPPHEDPVRLRELGLEPAEESWRAHGLTKTPVPEGVADGRMWYVPDEITRDTHPGLYIFLEHSDCDGEISPEDCLKVADDLEQILPLIRERPGERGHIASQGGYRVVLRTFIGGCRLAAERGEPLNFH